MRYPFYRQSFTLIRGTNREIDWRKCWVSPAGCFLPDCPGKNRSNRFPKPVWPVSPCGLSRRGFWARKSLLCHGLFCSDVERLLRCFGSLGRFWTKSVWPDCQTGLTGFPCLREAKSNTSGLTGFRNRPDLFGLPAAVSCVFPLRVCCGYWLGLAPRFSSTSVATWTWQEKLVVVHEWNRVHKPNSWIEFLSVPIHSPPLWFVVSVLHKSWAKPEALKVLTFLKHNPPSLPLDKFLLNSYTYKLHRGDDKAPERQRWSFFNSSSCCECNSCFGYQSVFMVVIIISCHYDIFMNHNQSLVWYKLLLHKFQY
jgi:hypothetical protein